jgi:hypothetical protein
MMLRPSNAGDTFETEPVDLEFMVRHIKYRDNFRNVCVWDPFVAPGSASQRYLASISIPPSNDLEWGREDTTKEAIRRAGVEYIVTNPPFSSKAKVLRDLISIGLPFAVILPTATMQRVFMQEFFKKGQWHIQIPSRFLRFHVGGRRCHSPPFPSAFYFWTPSELSYVSVGFINYPN